MQLDVLLGLQWGDEGKGKLVDVFTENYDYIARFQGGPNAGHTLIFDGKKFVLNTLPSGIFREKASNIIGNNVVIDPVTLKKEITNLKGYIKTKKLIISDRAHLILPTHKLLDFASEKSKGVQKIGSTLKGIGPTYMDKTGRNGIRVGDILESYFKEKYHSLKAKHLDLLEKFDVDIFSQEEEDKWFEAIDFLKKLKIIRLEEITFNNPTKKILAEGAQGTLLDINFGTYPFVTSSDTVTGGVFSGLGVSPANLKKVFGIFKAYNTRVGSGPFPTELFDDNGKFLAEKGKEFGATTGRARRCGWLDLVLLKYATQLNGVNRLAIMKSDVMSGMPKVKICTHYIVDGKKYNYMPYNILSKPVECHYETLDGWEEDVTQVKDFDNLPANLKKYIEFIEDYLKQKIQIVSVGPDRNQTIIRSNIFE